MGREENKVFLDLGEVSILEHSLSLFATLPFIREVVLVVSAADRPRFEGEFKGRLDDLGVTGIVTGGKRRIDSSRAGVEACRSDTDLILIHDAARPFPPASAVEEAVDVAARKGAAILAIPVSDTLKHSPNGSLVGATIPRAGLYCAQTPQVFRRDVIINAMRNRPGRDHSDDASLVESVGHPVSLVAGHEHNIKITTKSHLAMARAIYRIEKD